MHENFSYLNITTAVWSNLSPITPFLNFFINSSSISLYLNTFTLTHNETLTMKRSIFEPSSLAIPFSRQDGIQQCRWYILIYELIQVVDQTFWK